MGRGSIGEIEVIQGTNGPTAWTKVAAAARSARQRKRGSCTRYPCPDRIERWSSLIDNGSADGLSAPLRHVNARKSPLSNNLNEVDVRSAGCVLKAPKFYSKL